MVQHSSFASMKYICIRRRMLFCTSRIFPHGKEAEGGILAFHSIVLWKFPFCAVPLLSLFLPMLPLASLCSQSKAVLHLMLHNSRLPLSHPLLLLHFSVPLPWPPKSRARGNHCPVACTTLGHTLICLWMHSISSLLPFTPLLCPLQFHFALPAWPFPSAHPFPSFARQKFHAFRYCFSAAPPFSVKH